MAAFLLLIPDGLWDGGIFTRRSGSRVPALQARIYPRVTVRQGKGVVKTDFEDLLWLGIAAGRALIGVWWNRGNA